MFPEHVVFGNCSIDGAILKYANCSGASFLNASMICADMEDSDLTVAFLIRI